MKISSGYFLAKPFHGQYTIYSTAATLNTYSPMKMEQTQCSETLAFKLQTPGITQKKANNIQNMAKVINPEDT
jgi:hypothetical protein